MGCIFRPSGKAEGVRRNCQDCSNKNKSEIQISSKERSQELLQTKNDALHHFIMFLLFANFPFLFLLSSRVVSHGLLLTNELAKVTGRTWLHCIRLWDPSCWKCPPCWLWGKTSGVGKAHVAKSWRWPLANSPLETETISPTAHRELKAANNHRREEADPRPDKPQRRLAWLWPYKGPNFEILNVCCCKLLSLW